MSIQATPPVKQVENNLSSEQLMKSEYVLKVNNISTPATPVSKAERLNPNNLPSARVKNIKKRRRIIVLSLFFVFAFIIATYLGYTASFELYKPNTEILNFTI